MPPQTALAVDHEREQVRGAAEPAHGAELGEGPGEVAHPVGHHPERLARGGHPPGPADGGLGVGQRRLEVVGLEGRGDHDEVLGDPLGVLLGQGAQLLVHRAVELLAGDLVGDARLGQAGRLGCQPRSSPGLALVAATVAAGLPAVAAARRPRCRHGAATRTAERPTAAGGPPAPLRTGRRRGRRNRRGRSSRRRGAGGDRRPGPGRAARHRRTGRCSRRTPPSTPRSCDLGQHTDAAAGTGSSPTRRRSASRAQRNDATCAQRTEDRERAHRVWWALSVNGCPAASYSPTPSPVQYHRR